MHDEISEERARFLCRGRRQYFAGVRERVFTERAKFEDLHVLAYIRTDSCKYALNGTAKLAMFGSE
jgi:hypothetical protein